MTALPSRLAPLLAPGTPALELSARFAAAGYELYLVGGSVRDALLDRVSDRPDLDFATDAGPDEVQRIVAPWAADLYLAGTAFGTVGAVRDGHVYEITTYRSEVYRDDSRKPRVRFSDSVEEDLSRRDFTVNAMAILVPGGSDGEPRLVDPYGGAADLAAGLLRTPLDPEISFGDDPLRMLRLFRFVSTLGFVPDPAALDAVAAMHERLRIVSPERIQGEFDRLLVGEAVGPALWGLVRSGLADEFIPEVPALAVQQDPMHRHKDVLAHSIAVTEKVSPDVVLRLAALFHDVGKPDTRRIDDGVVSFHHHEAVGARMTKDRLKALKYPTKVVDAVSRLVFLHMRPHTYKMGWTDSAVRRYVRDAGPLLGQLNELVRSDVTTRNRKRARTIERRIDELEQRIAELREREELDSLRPPIDGHQVMAHLGLEPGPEVGAIMHMLLERRIDDGPFSEEEAYAMLDQWVRAR